MRLHYKIKDGEMIQYMDVMSLYPWVRKYFKFPVGHPTDHVGEKCREYVAKRGLDKVFHSTSKTLVLPCTTVPV
jgi:hypothetical protein